MYLQKYIYFLICLISFLLPFIINSQLVKVLFNFNKKYNLKFNKDQRRIQELNKSRLGGVGILLSVASSLFVLNQLLSLIHSDLKITIPVVMVFIILSFSLLGILDDLFGLSPFYRLILQIFLSSVAWSNGLRIEALNFQFITSDPLSINLPYLVSLIITILWIAGLTNAINWLDGLDGLAASFSSIAFLVFAILFFNANNDSLALLSLSSLGSCIGFLRYNFYPSKIFMGDGGSYFLGSLLACTTILYHPINSNNLIDPIFNLDNSILIVVPFLLFLIPILDMVSVISQRLINKESPFYPDKRHIHYKLKDNGLDQRDIVFFSSSISLWLGFSAIYCINQNIFNYIFLIFSYLFLLLATIYYGKKVFYFRRNKISQSTLRKKE